MNISFDYITPDCVQRNPVTLVNGQYPGPPIKLKTNEVITITVRNYMKGMATTMHWHGIDQIGTPWADGAAGTSECAVGPMEERTYEFKAPPYPGTHYYHGHVGVAKEMGAYGLVLVDPDICNTWPEAMQHDKYYDMVVNDWYHAPALTLTTGLVQTDFRWAGDPQSILVNGRGHFDCDNNAIYTCQDEVCSETSKTMCTAKQRPYYLVASAHQQCSKEHCPAKAEFEVEKGKKYLFRIVNAGSLSFLNLKLENHTMTVVELDGEPVKPITVTSVDMHAGQRVGLIITADQPHAAYWISLTIRGRSNARFGTAIMRYANSSKQEPLEKSLDYVRSLQPGWDDVGFTMAQQRSFEHPFAKNAPSAAAVYRRIVVLGTQEWFDPDETNHVPSPPGINTIGVGKEKPEAFCKKSGKNYLKWAANRVPHKTPRTPALHSLYYDTPSKEHLDEAHGFYLLEKDQVYEIVLQNYPACNGACETHPWHLHGHHFWVVGTWPGEFNGTLPAEGSGGTFYKRDTVMVVGEGHNHKPAPGRGCGFTVIRFKADNPGVWPFHCHAEWHQLMGMALTFYYRAETLPDPNQPSYASVCGDVTVQKAAAKLNTVPLFNPLLLFEQEAGKPWFVRMVGGQSPVTMGFVAIAIATSGLVLWLRKNTWSRTYTRGTHNEESPDTGDSENNSSGESIGRETPRDF